MIHADNDSGDSIRIRYLGFVSRKDNNFFRMFQKNYSELSIVRVNAEADGPKKGGFEKLPPLSTRDRLISKGADWRDFTLKSATSRRVQK